jgi:hypothetical protein
MALHFWHLKYEEELIKLFNSEYSEKLSSSHFLQKGQVILILFVLFLFVHPSMHPLQK